MLARMSERNLHIPRLSYPAQVPRAVGFTLIEMSIVLVIIGLLVGGVLVGRDLIKASEVHAQISNLSEYTSAVNVFRMRYGYLPGDIPKSACEAAGIPNWGNDCADPATTPGVGNGIINGDNDATLPVSRLWIEPTLFFIELTDVGLLKGYAYNPGSYTIGAGGIFPALVTNSAAGLTVASLNDHLWYFLGISTPGSDPRVSQLSQRGVLSPAYSYALDQKMDDGLPGKGTVLAVVPNSLASGELDSTLDTTAGQCVSSSDTTAYNVTSDTLWCRIFVRAQ